ncbi:unnamed protein product [Paramecium sonneborni]|uniref:Uncharacterized protein n=1 Tax=Paramecium sonneborni TaxID=65129 RepID=A0A8S1L4B3_9CILI|nr:unnamed protein product [Paramecium sonneborni]
MVKVSFQKMFAKNSIVIPTTFQSFLEQMMNDIIQYISDQKLITIKEILQIPLRQYLTQYQEIYFNQFIRNLLSENIKKEILVTVNQENQLSKLDWDQKELEF